MDRIALKKYSTLEVIHQSAARFGDYAFFIANGLESISVYNLRTKKVVNTLSLEKNDFKIYHCNQSSFGISKYLEDDLFPLLYVSQRAREDGRCFIEVLRIISSGSSFISGDTVLSIEKVQTIYLPKMTYENALGNANCVIDLKNNRMITYSRNNNSFDDNYGDCRISCFDIPNYKYKEVFLEDSDIRFSFTLECTAFNMQGACIVDNLLFIGQGYESVGYILFNVVDLDSKQLLKQFNLMSLGYSWEPEGCFYYDGSVMVASNTTIWRIDKKEYK
ncbi:MAG: hypothetical protein IJL58_05810 [Bacteroidales bacterium]|nr:hypothetical protein [Bacteroidales bacterium]